MIALATVSALSALDAIMRCFSGVTSADPLMSKSPGMGIDKNQARSSLAQCVLAWSIASVRAFQPAASSPQYAAMPPKLDHGVNTTNQRLSVFSIGSASLWLVNAMWLVMLYAW